MQKIFDAFMMYIIPITMASAVIFFLLKNRKIFVEAEKLSQAKVENIEAKLVNKYCITNTSQTLYSKNLAKSLSEVNLDNYDDRVDRYFFKFETENGSKLEFQVNEIEYNMKSEGDTGFLTYKGNQYLFFDKNTSLVSNQACTVNNNSPVFNYNETYNFAQRSKKEEKVSIDVSSSYLNFNEIDNTKEQKRKEDTILYKAFYIITFALTIISLICTVVFANRSDLISFIFIGLFLIFMSIFTLNGKQFRKIKSGPISSESFKILDNQNKSERIPLFLGVFSLGVISIISGLIGKFGTESLKNRIFGNGNLYILLMILAFTYFTILYLLKQRKLKEVCTEKINALVVDRILELSANGTFGKRYKPVFSYFYNDKEYRLSLSYTVPEYSQGQIVEILVNPENPEEFIISKDKDYKGMLFIICISFFILAFIIKVFK